MKDIVIFGAGGFAKEVAFLIEDINKKSTEWNILGYIVEDVEKIGDSHGKYPIYQTDGWLMHLDAELHVVAGVGNPDLLSRIVKNFQENKNLIFPNLIHPSVFGDFDRIKMKEGNIICAGNIFTTDISLGSFNILNLSCTIGHDVKIGNYNVINPTVNISGGVIINDFDLVGVGTQILQYIEIGNNVVIGAGSVVTKNALEAGVYVGAPARKIK